MSDVVCEHPRCTQLVIETFKARLREAYYCSHQCRARDNARLKQLNRRNTHATQKNYEKWYKIRVKYGITQEQWQKLFDAQHGCCAICQINLENVKTCVDHEHSSGKIRGLLCNRCNQGIGYFSDNAAVLNIAARYVQGGEADE